MALKILLADDSMIAQNLGKKILTDAGHEVVAVSNGAAAVKKIAEVKPQLAILDIYMPGYTGLEVCERMKNAPETAHIPVLLTVGKMEPYRPEDGAKVKAEGVIIKPFEGSDLLAAVNKLAEKLAQPKPALQYEQANTSSPEALQEFTVDSYEEPAPDTAASAAPAPDMSLPAFGMDEFSMEPPAPPPPVTMAAAAGVAMASLAAPVSFAEAHVFAVEDTSAVAHIEPFVPAVAQPVESVVDAVAAASEPEIAPEPSFVPELIAAEPVEIAALVEVETATPVTVDPTTAQAVTFDLPATDAMPELEFNSAPHVEVRVEPTPDFEPTILQNEIVIEEAFAVDPALVLDPTEMVTAFPTKFGVEEAEEGPVDVSSEETSRGVELVDEASVEAQPFVTELPGSVEEAALMMPSIIEPSEDVAPAPSMEALPDFEDFSPAMADVMPELANPEEHVAFATDQAAESVPEWQAHEAAIDASEADISLDEEMQRAFASLEEKLETPLVPVEPVVAEPQPEKTFVQEVAAPAPELVDVPAGQPEPVMDTDPTISDDPELASAMDAAFASLDAHDGPETIIELPSFEEPQSVETDAVVALEPPVAAEPFVEESAPPLAETVPVAPVELSEHVGLSASEPVAAEPEPLEAIETELARRAVVMEPSIAVVNDVSLSQATVDEGRVAAAVARVMERMKTQIVAEIVKELQSD